MSGVDLGAVAAKLRTRYGLDYDGAVRGKFSGTLVAVVDADENQKFTFMEQVTKDLSGTAGTFVRYWTVPEGERWKLRHMRVDASTGNHRPAIRNVAGLVRTTLAGDATAENFLSNPFGEGFLESGYEIGVNATGNAGDTSRDVTIVVERYRS